MLKWKVIPRENAHLSSVNGLCFVDELSSLFVLFIQFCQSTTFSYIFLFVSCPSVLVFRNRTWIAASVLNPFTWTWSRSRSRLSIKTLLNVCNNGCFNARITTDQRTKLPGKFEFLNKLYLFYIEQYSDICCHVIGNPAKAKSCWRSRLATVARISIQES